MFILPFLVYPRRVDPLRCTSEKGEESSGRKASCPDPDARQRPVWNSSRQFGKQKLPGYKSLRVIQRLLPCRLAQLKSATGRTRCFELCAHFLDLCRLLLHGRCEGRNFILLLRHGGLEVLL